MLPAFRLQNNLPVSQQIYAFLRHHITELTIKPGTRLSENDLSAQFSVSRQPVREAIFRLKRQGLIEVYPQKGSFVTRISGRNIMETCFVRSSIEKAALQRGMLTPDADTKKIVAELEDNLRQQHELTHDSTVADPDALFLKQDNEFHQILCKLSGTKLAWEVIDDIKANLDRIRYLSTKGVSRIENIVGEHQQIFDLMTAGKVDEAMASLHDHLYEIAMTYRAIRAKNEEWFVPEA